MRYQLRLACTPSVVPHQFMDQFKDLHDEIGLFYDIRVSGLEECRAFDKLQKKFRHDLNIQRVYSPGKAHYVDWLTLDGALVTPWPFPDDEPPVDHDLRMRMRLYSLIDAVNIYLEKHPSVVEL